jgi:hypothetical protein
LGTVALAGLAVAAALLVALPSHGDKAQAATGVDAVPQLAPTVQSVNTETHYVPVTPCRIVDTRAGVGTGKTKIANNQTRAYYVGGTFGFAPQGGKGGGCAIPVGATAIAATLTAVAPTHGGFMRAWPNGVAEPSATALNYGTFSIGTGATITINSSSAYALKVKNYGGPTDLVVDVAGYYAKPMAALIQSDGIAYDGTSRVVNSGRLGVGQYWVEFDRDITYCQATASAYNIAAVSRVDTFSDAATTRVRVILYNSVGAVTDGWFYLIVSC